eukprot:COSAG03_NODE_5695_length_1194_cov_3.784475_1_plen_161_part_00
MHAFKHGPNSLYQSELFSFLITKGMSTPFDLPNLDTEADRIRALGVKNSGVKEFRQDRVFPVNRLDSDSGSLSDGKLLEFRLRSDSNQWINWRETKIKAEFEIALKMSVGMNSWLQQIRLSLPFSIRGLPLCDNLSASLQVVKKSERGHGSRNGRGVMAL